MMIPILQAGAGTPEEHYNNVHCRTRCAIERCFGLLKARWRCLLRHRVLHYSPEKVGQIINCCAILHNIAIDAGVPEPEAVNVNEMVDNIEMEAPNVQPLDQHVNRQQLLPVARNIRNQLVARLWERRRH